ncbi:Hsl1 [Kluyveromyces lactis]|nr:Hsl1 [Kluyveromyces lactis]
MSCAVQAAVVAMKDNSSHGQVPYRANNEHLNRVVQSVTDATKRLSQISTASSNANVNNTKTSKRRNRDTVGPWKLGKTLGKGSSGRVRLAKNMETGKLSAIKIVPKKFVKSNQIKQLPYGIEREIIIMKLISHPNVMGLYEVWENKSELYLVLEYVEGGELFDYLVSKGKLPESEAIHYFKQIVQAVAYCHGFNICHRDLKPENLLLDKKKRSIKIADFGMAALETSDKLLETSCGSPHYASPEIVLGRKYHGSPSDVWSCGIILFALLTGHLPFNDDNVKKLLLKVQSGKYQMPQWLSVEAKDLISRILVVDPNRRITIDQILQHELLTKYDQKSRSKSNSDLNLLNRTPNIVNFSSERDIDETILSNLQILWHGAARKHLVTRLMKPGFTEEKMFYSLLWNYQEKQQKSMQKDSIPVPTVKTSSASSVSPLHTSSDVNSVTNTAKKQQQSSNGTVLPVSMAPTISAFGQQISSDSSESSTLQAPKIHQKSHFSISSLKNGSSKSPKKTKQGFIASSSSSKLFQPNFGAKSSSQSISKSSSKKSLTPTTPKKRTLQNSASKRSLYSLQSISKRSINLNELLHDELQHEYPPPPLPSISSSEHTSSKLESIVDDYDRSTSVHDTAMDNFLGESGQHMKAQQIEKRTQPSKNILAQPKLNNQPQTENRQSVTSMKRKTADNTIATVPVSMTPLKDMTNTFQSKSMYVSSLDPKRNKPKPSLENLLRKVSVPQRIKSRSTIRKLRDSGDWTVSGEAQALFGGKASSEGENPLQRQKTNPSKLTAPETVLTTSTPMTNIKPDLLRMPSSLINSSMTFKDLSQFIMNIDEDKVPATQASNPVNTDHGKHSGNQTLMIENDSNRFETSSNYDDYNANTAPAVTTAGDIDIFEDAPDDANESVTTSESMVDQSQRNLKKKAASIDSIDTSHVLTPATDVRVSLYINQMDKLDNLPRETTEQIISKFKLSPIKDIKQKRFSNGDRDLTITGSMISMFKDLDGDESRAEYEDNGLGLLGSALDTRPVRNETNEDTNGTTVKRNSTVLVSSINGDNLDLSTEEQKNDDGNHGQGQTRRVTLLFDDGSSESEQVFKPAASERRQPTLNGNSTTTNNVGSKRKSNYVNKLPKIKEDEVKPITSKKSSAPVNWFSKLLQRIKTSKPKRTVYEYRTSSIPFDNIHILLMTQFGKNGVDCELKKMERKGDKEYVTYDCNFGGIKRNRPKSKFTVEMRCMNGTETVLSLETRSKRFVNDKDTMASFERFNKDVAGAISAQEE